MIRTILAFPLLAATSLAAHAGCELIIGDCRSDAYGNTYRTEQNLGGGYTTTQNGDYYSSTSQTLSGNWQDRYDYGGTRGMPADSEHPWRKPGDRW